MLLIGCGEKAPDESEMRRPNGKTASGKPIDQPELLPLSGGIATDLKVLLPTGYYKANEYVPDPPQRLIDYETKLTSARKADPQWFMAYERKAAEQGLSRPPYHPKYGLTKAEWKDYYESSGNIPYKKGRQGQLEIGRDGGIVTIAGTGITETLDGTEINTDNLIVTAPFGYIYYEGFLSRERAAVGAWQGHFWRYDGIDPQTELRKGDVRGRVYEFAVGRLKQTGETILILTIQDHTQPQGRPAATLRKVFVLAP